ncbi:YfhE family protein [Bacillus sp. JCM 19034]|nr:YfhE family protein [Bacillus sp. JCM 19034]
MENKKRRTQDDAKKQLRKAQEVNYGHEFRAADRAARR